jgi:hypothetical protein
VSVEDIIANPNYIGPTDDTVPLCVCEGAGNFSYAVSYIAGSIPPKSAAGVTDGVILKVICKALSVGTVVLGVENSFFKTTDRNMALGPSSPVVPLTADVQELTITISDEFGGG